MDRNKVTDELVAYSAKDCIVCTRQSGTIVSKKIEVCVRNLFLCVLNTNFNFTD